MAKRKRSAKKIKDGKQDPDANLPQRKTEEIAETHKKAKRTLQEHYAFSKIGEAEDGKEAFDFVLKGMTKPDNQ